MIEIDTHNIEEKLKKYSKQMKKLLSISVDYLPLNELRSFAVACGNNVKELKLEGHEIEASELIEVLNQMPKLEKLSIELDDRYEYDSESDESTSSNSPKRIKLNEDLKLPKLKVLNIGELSTLKLFQFFTQHLEKNSITEFSCPSSNLSDYSPDLCKAACEFFGNQKSIKSFESSRAEILKALNVLRPDEISLSNSEEYQQGNSFATELQPQLKTLKISTELDESFAKDLSKLSNLEKLEVSYSCEFDMNMLQSFPKLKVLDSKTCLKNFDSFINNQWTSTQFENLTQLIIGKNYIEISEVLNSFPNLKILYVDTSLKINTFAKFLPKLEILRIDYGSIDQIFEANTGTKNESLKELLIDFENEDEEGCFWTFGEQILELPQLCPNLEVLNFKFSGVNCSCHRSEEDIEKQLEFFKMLNEFTKLKTLKIKDIPIKNLVEKWLEIGSDLRKLSQSTTTREISIKFEDWFENDERHKNFSYKKLANSLRRRFKLEADPSLSQKDASRNTFFCLKILYKK